MPSNKTVFFFWMYMHFDIRIVVAWLAALCMFLLFFFLCFLKPTFRSLLQSSSLAAINSADSCENLSGLNKKQTEICKRNIELMGAVRVGAELAINECQTQFRSRRWNCSALDGTAVFGKILNEGTREAAFVHAITSAGVAYAVTRVCSSGQLMKCGCDRTIYGLAQGFQWAGKWILSICTTCLSLLFLPPQIYSIPSYGHKDLLITVCFSCFLLTGCSDNVAYGTAFSKTFVDARDIKGARVKKPTASSARSMMNLHNNEAGRKIILENMRIDCKCHGVSGSCELKTCWRATPSFREIGQMLNDKFDSATEVQLMLPQGDGKGLATLAPKARREARGQLKKSIHQKVSIFLRHCQVF